MVPTVVPVKGLSCTRQCTALSTTSLTATTPHNSTVPHLGLIGNFDGVLPTASTTITAKYCATPRPVVNIDGALPLMASTTITLKYCATLRPVVHLDGVLPTASTTTTSNYNEYKS